MTESLSIISGKGGSGKTTIAISLTQLLAICGKNVLLVDCDLSTNGATYFFEELLTEKNQYCTFSEIVQGKIDKDSLFHTKKVLKVNENIDYIPSQVDFSEYVEYTASISSMNSNISSVLSLLTQTKNYDVIIYDCQAGFSVATAAITDLTTKNLAVIEADAISASSLRILYSQLSNQLDSGTTYQIFNKITKEEEQIYSKITHGTLFTNLPPLLFDWNIRKAFLTKELPKIDASNALLTNSIYVLAGILFPQYKDAFRRFILTVKKQMLIDVEDETASVLTPKIRRSFKFLFRRILNNQHSMSAYERFYDLEKKRKTLEEEILDLTIRIREENGEPHE